MSSPARVIDLSVRFLRSNPEVVAYAGSAALDCGLSVDDILRDAVRRLRESAGEAVAQEEVVA